MNALNDNHPPHASDKVGPRWRIFPKTDIKLFLLLAPITLLIVVFLIIPIVIMFNKAVSGDEILAAYIEVLRSPVYINVFMTTLKIATMTTVLTLILGYPVAFALRFGKPKYRAIVLMLIVLPYWLDFIVRSYSWMILLGRRGIVNEALLWLGLVDRPVKLLYSLGSVVTGMVQIMLPMMILTLFAAMLRIDAKLMDAANIHGANRWKSFTRVFMPLSLPGVYGASLLVFVTALGFYITPALLGGPSETMISQSMLLLASELLDWKTASIAGTLLLFVTTILVLIYNRLFSIDRLWGGE